MHNKPTIDYPANACGYVERVTGEHAIGSGPNKAEMYIKKI